MSPPINTQQYDQPSNREVLDQMVRFHEDMTKRFDRQDRILTGGDEPDKGLVVQVDRIKQEQRRIRQENEKRHGWTKMAIGTSLAAVLGLAGELIRGALAGK